MMKCLSLVALIGICVLAAPQSQFRSKRDVTEDLFNAVKNGNYGDAKRLIEGGANVNSADNFGRTPLHYAAENGHDKVVKLLIRNGSNVSAVDKYGQTPLHLAAQNGHDEVAELLIRNGSNLSVVTNNGSTLRGV